MKILMTAMAALVLCTAAAQANEPYFPRGEKRFARLDVNRDGKLEPGELESVVQRRTATIDTNGDRQVSAAEIEAAMQRRIEARRGRMMNLMDGDRNGMISPEEADRVLKDMFDKADTDDDGAVSLAEIQNFKRAQWRKEFLERQGN